MSYNLYPKLGSKIIFKSIIDNQQLKAKLISISGKEIDLNESSEKVIMECDGSNSIKDIALKLSTSYDKTPLEIIEARLVSLLNNLKKQGFVEFVYLPVKNKKRKIMPKQPLREYPFINLFLECTNACNLKCTHCYLGDIEKSTELPLEQIKNILDQFSDIGGEYVTLTGGEPFSRKDIFDIMEYASSLPLFITLFSNGTLINEEVAKRLHQSNIVEVQISLDGAKAKTHDTYRGKVGAYDDTIKGIEALLRERIKVNIATVVNKLNLDELIDIVDICKKWNITPGFSYQDFQGRAIMQGKNAQLKYCEYAMANIKVRKYISETTNEKPFNIKISEKINLKAHRCSAGFSSLTIRCNGDVYPCLDLNMPQAKLGNIKEKRIDEIWNHNHPFLNSLRNTYVSDMKFCPDCKHLIYCHGGCPAVAYEVWGDFNMPDPKKCAYYAAAQDHLVFKKQETEASKERTVIICDK